jgi:hypothetical protein
MNISQAKDYIKNSINIYLKKDEFGDYRIPVVRQRPIFLLGAPGIGKTAIMEQIAEELGIALVSYSMTHHTRQSAIGLPFIKQKNYDGKTYDVSEYTMSEIIASIYETMEESGVKEGILFLDEINCVSETLAPSMLQFLQYKVFGRHQVPEGWVIVTAGNPPEYNKSVREYDVVTLDRLKVLTVEADYKTWREYAIERSVHPSILNFLELKKDFFYHMETTASGRHYVTARGWEDLSEIIYMYEEDGLSVDETLIGQYIRSENIVKEFAAYYDLYNKYKNDYKVDEILSGNISELAVTRAKNAGFDERLSLLGMLLDKVQSGMKECVATSDYLSELMAPLKACKQRVSRDNKAGATAGVEHNAAENAGQGTAGNGILEMLTLQSQARDKIMENKERANALSKSEKLIHKRIKRFLDESAKELVTNGLAGGSASDQAKAFEYIKSKFDGEVDGLKKYVSRVGTELHNLFEFAAKAFEDGNEMLILVTELTVSKSSSRFISMYGSEDYHKYNKLLMITERQQDMKESIRKLDLGAVGTSIDEIGK